MQVNTKVTDYRSLLDIAPFGWFSEADQFGLNQKTHGIFRLPKITSMDISFASTTDNEQTPERREI